MEPKRQYKVQSSVGSRFCGHSWKYVKCRRYCLKNLMVLHHELKNTETSMGLFEDTSLEYESKCRLRTSGRFERIQWCTVLQWNNVRFEEWRLLGCYAAWLL
jgi:hypothetical protein